MPEKRLKWTKQQQQAITEKGGDILVSASAGTGKTAVLSGRYVNILSEKETEDVQNMLVLTFTDAAAEQMRCRIADYLREYVLQTDDARMKGQIVQLPAADISTLHSFCKRLITAYFYRLGIDPAFKIIDGDEQQLLKAEVLEKTIDWAWRQDHLSQAMHQLLRRRVLHTDDTFLIQIIKLSNFLDGVVSRQNWYERALNLADTSNILDSEVGQKQREIILGKLRHVLSQIQHAQKLYESQQAGGSWSEKWQENFAEPIIQFLELIQAGEWDKFRTKITEYEKPSRFEYKPRGMEGPLAGIIENTAHKAKNDFGELFELAVLNPRYLDIVAKSASLQTKVVIEILRKFDRLYRQAKDAINCLDFADLEHYAMTLLTEKSDNEDSFVPSEIALAQRQKYKHVFVDEYQDINPVQQTILDMLAGDGNVFVVGDVKQSIYAWRGAEPQIFLNRLKPASAKSGRTGKGIRVDLNYNFRSAKGILDFVNKVFSRIMTGEFAGIDYDESARLKPFDNEQFLIPTKNGQNPIVELHILDEQDTDQIAEQENTENTETYSPRRHQAAMIAQRIKKMTGAENGRAEFQIYDKQSDSFRDVEYRDIVILMRSLSKKANDYVEILRLSGIPVSCEATAGYFETTEINDMLSLLKVLDNPQRDIELAAVLRSPLFNITETELAKIKLYAKKRQYEGNFYNCLQRYCEDGPDAKLAARLKEILETINQWRSVARRGNLADLIWQVYRQTDFLSFVCSLPSGQTRRANLLKLHDRAIQFEGFAGSWLPIKSGLNRFVDFIEKLAQAGQDWAPAEPDSSSENAVRILSVHKSKGLEFPVVFLAELDSSFNLKDTQTDFLINSDDTLGVQIINHDSNLRIDSITHQVIAEQKRLQSLAEEMRILYVAASRARQRLILSASEKSKHCRSVLCNGFYFKDSIVPDWQLRACKSHLDWILYGLCDQEILHRTFETDLLRPQLTGEDSNLFTVNLYNQGQLLQLNEYIEKIRKTKTAKLNSSDVRGEKITAEKNILSKIKESLSWEYQFSRSCKIPAKSSVSQLTHPGDEYTIFDHWDSLYLQPKATLYPIPYTLSSVDSKLIGTATHLVIAELDLKKCVTEKSILQTIENLLAKGSITKKVVRSIDIAAIVKFFDSDLGRLALDEETEVLREWPFTFALPASQMPESSPFINSKCEVRDTIIVQGIIDMLIKTAKGLVIIDFKTDNVTVSQAPQRARFYRSQLDLYSRAAGEILGLKIEAKWLYFLMPGCPVGIE